MTHELKTLILTFNVREREFAIRIMEALKTKPAGMESLHVGDLLTALSADIEAQFRDEHLALH